MGIPKPGKPVRGSRTGRPIMALLDLLGRRWLARIVWELNEAPMTFRELRSRCDEMSPTVLNQRLSELREARIVEIASDGGYTLTATGKALLKAMMPMLAWSAMWEKELNGELTKE
jgi:DNA-binding HxlR family transcriptional regulator